MERSADVVKKLLTEQGEPEKSGWIGVDLDGTLAHYDGWKGVEHIGEPIERMVNRVKYAIKQGITIKLFTARAIEPECIPYIEDWLGANGLGELEITNVKDFDMIELWDDKVVQVEQNTGRFLGKSPAGLF